MGLVSSIGLILLSPDFMKNPWFPLKNPAIIRIPLGVLGAFLGTFFSREPSAEKLFSELKVRANTGLSAEKASPH